MLAPRGRLQNLDIVPPECAFKSVSYTMKWVGIEVAPLGAWRFAQVLVLVFMELSCPDAVVALLLLAAYLIK